MTAAANTIAHRSGYTVVGGGAIGGTLAVHLAMNDVPVHIVDTDADHVQAINKRGLSIETPNGTLSARVPATTPAYGPEKLGAVVLAVKSHATNAALDWIAPRLSQHGWVASMQNGLNESTIAARIGATRTVAAFVDLFADVISPGVIKDGGHGTIALGEFSTEPGPRAAPGRVPQLATDLSRWGTPVVSENVSGFLWSKIAFGAVLVGTSLQDEDMSVLVDRHRCLWTTLVREVLAVADAEGIHLETFDTFEPDLYRAGVQDEVRNSSIDSLVSWLEGQDKKRSGVWRDLAVRKRPTEVPYQYQAIIDIASRHGLPMPGLRTLVNMIHQLETQDAQMGPHLIKRLASAIQEPRPYSEEPHK